MSMYVPPEDQGPTSAEGGELLDDPQEEDVPEIEHPTRLAGETADDVRRRDERSAASSEADGDPITPPERRGESR